MTAHDSQLQPTGKAGDSPPGRPFLTASWRNLVMLNYRADPALLTTHIPPGTELDEWNGETYISIVGFLFQDTAVCGVRIPLHTNFEEINLRFYVRRKGAEGWRRGVTFLREIVPRRAIAVVANAVYNENYLAIPMRHTISLPDESQNTGTFTYAWRHTGQWQSVNATTHGPLHDLQPGSHEEFIAEHYWGYAKSRHDGCIEYQVAHPRWRYWEATEANLTCDVADVYGRQYVGALSSPPDSAFVAEGSEVAVYRGLLHK